MRKKLNYSQDDYQIYNRLLAEVRGKGKGEGVKAQFSFPILPQLTILSFDLKTAEIYGRISAELAKKGQPLAHPDLQIAATALQHSLELVTGNLKHFGRVSGLKINPVLSKAKTDI